MHSHELIDCLILLASHNKISCKDAALISMGPINCICIISVTQGCTYSSTPLESLTVPLDFSHKTSKCQCISQHQEIERRLQVNISSKRQPPLQTRKTYPYVLITPSSSSHNNGLLFSTVQFPIRRYNIPHWSLKLLKYRDIQLPTWNTYPR